MGLVLRKAVSLSERRGAFVSAVTHELRTPLTTFQLYSDMLASGRIKDPEKLERYHETLKAESERLGHLVENVLGYARLEHGRTGSKEESLEVQALLDRACDRLAKRAEQAGMELDLHVARDVGRARIHTAVGSVEQILFNLVDNACKYSASASQRRIHLDAARQGGDLVLRVRDHGPGIPADVARKLFHPFTRSSREGEQPTAGVGLGLAFSRRLAQSLGGRLEWKRESADGCLMELRLPLSP